MVKSVLWNYDSQNNKYSLAIGLLHMGNLIRQILSLTMVGRKSLDGIANMKLGGELMNFENVFFEEKDKVGYIALNNPDNMNPITVNVVKDFIECLNYCEKDNDIRAIVIRGSGGNFSAGGNIKNMKEKLDNHQNEVKVGIRAAGELIMRIKTINKPTIAWIEGAVAGVGLSIAMACDFSIADQKSKFVFAFVNIAYVPDGGLTYLLTKAVGTVKATELLMSGRKLSGAEAKDWGIITEAVPTDTLEQTVNNYINKYSNGPTKTYGYIKTLINRVSYSELNACMQNEVEAQYMCSLTEDHREALTAFIEKRKPVFKGC